MSLKKFFDDIFCAFFVCDKIRPLESADIQFICNKVLFMVILSNKEHRQSRRLEKHVGCFVKTKLNALQYHETLLSSFSTNLVQKGAWELQSLIPKRK